MNEARPQVDAPPSNAPSMPKEIEHFVHQINALQTSLPLVTMLMDVSEIVAGSRYREYLKSHGELLSTEGAIETYRLPEHLVRQVDRLHSDTVHAQIGKVILPRSFLVSLVSAFDSFVGKLLYCLFSSKIDLMNASAKQMSYGDLMQFDSMEDVKEHLLEKEIESVLRESHAEQFQRMEKTFGLPLRKDLPARQVFIELTERRNLFAHCNGVVSSQYRNVCKSHGVDVSVHNIGDQLEVDGKYFADAWKCVYEIGVKLAHVLWRKVLPSQREDADNNLNEIIYELIAQENYELAAVLGEFAVDLLKCHFSDKARRVFVVNLAQVYKWQRRKDLLRKRLASEDWTACGSDFQMAIAVLNDDFEQAATIMRAIGKSSVMPTEAYLVWPIFKDFRKTKFFLTAYEDVFGKPFEPIKKTRLTINVAPRAIAESVQQLTETMIEYHGPEFI